MACYWDSFTYFCVYSFLECGKKKCMCSSVSLYISLIKRSFHYGIGTIQALPIKLQTVSVKNGSFRCDLLPTGDGAN
jgi:hypothetical protein